MLKSIKDYPGTSWMYDDEREGLVKIIPPNGKFLEIGTWTGTTAAWLADRRPDIKITCVDTFAGASCGNKPTDDKVILTWFKNRRLNMNLWVGFVTDLPIAQYDCILVDGDHSDGYCYHDLIDSMFRVLRGSSIIVHDYYSDEHPGVKAAVTRFLANYPTYHIAGRWTTAIILKD